MKTLSRIKCSLAFIWVMGALLIVFTRQARQEVWDGTKRGLRGIWTA